MHTLTFDGEPADLNAILTMPELQSVNIISIRFDRWRDEERNDKGGRIDVDTEDFASPIIYKTEVHATDFLVSAPKIKDNPELALDEAIAEMEKGEGNRKSIALIALSIAKYLKAKKNKLK